VDARGGGDAGAVTTHNGPLHALVNVRTGASRAPPLGLVTCPKVAAALISTGAVEWTMVDAQGNTALHTAARLCVAHPHLFSVLVTALKAQVCVCLCV
jgi:hypothetical protein